MDDRAHSEGGAPSFAVRDSMGRLTSELSHGVVVNVEVHGGTSARWHECTETQRASWRPRARQACTQQGSHSVGQLLAVLARVVDHAVLAGANLVVVARRRFPYAGAVHHEVAPRRVCTHDSSTHTSPRGVTALFPRVAARWDSREGEDRGPAAHNGRPRQS